MRVVITGGPSVGKTTIVKILEEKGYRVVHEIATRLIKEGKILPWDDRARFQAEVLRRQLEAESSLLEFDLITFLDRGAFDGEAYYRCDDLPVPPTFSMEFTEKITCMIEKCYAERNIKVLRVPFMAPEDRVRYILAEVEKARDSKVASPEQAATMFRVNAQVVSSFVG